MAKKRTQEEPKKAHQHTWKTTKDVSLNRCDCGTWLMSQKEFTRRKFAWNKYYKLVRTTFAFKIFQLQKKAMAKNRYDLVRRYAEQLNQRIKKHGLDLKEPTFFEPNSSYTVISSEQTNMLEKMFTDF